MANELLGIDWASAMGDARLAWTAALAGGMVLGLVLWLLGGKLARAGTVLAGFVIGGVAVSSLAVGVASSTGAGAWVLLFGVGGAIAGALLAWLLFRLWMGLTAAALFALVVPAAVLIWNPPSSGVEGDGSEAAEVSDSVSADGESASIMDSLRETLEEGMAEAFADEDMQAAMSETVTEAAANGEAVAGEDLVAGLDAGKVQDIAMAQAGRVWEVFKGAWAKERERFGVWWDGLPTGTRTTVMGGSAVGGVLGLLLGLVLPNILAKLQTAFAGSLLLFFPAGVLVNAYLVEPLNEAGLEAEEHASAGVAGLASYWPSAPREVLVALGLITLVGLLLQCTIFRRKADS